MLSSPSAQPHHHELASLSARLRHPRHRLTVAGLFKANLPKTCSPNSATVPFHAFPVRRLHAVRPSCPTWYRVMMKAACLISQRTTGSVRSSFSRRRASSASTRRRAMSMTSCAAFSAPPCFLCSSLALRIVRTRIAHHGLASWPRLGQRLLQRDRHMLEDPIVTWAFDLAVVSQLGS